MESGLLHLLRRTTRADASRQLGIDLRAVTRMIESGELKTVVMPGSLRSLILQSSIDDVLAKMRDSIQQAN